MKLTSDQFEAILRQDFRLDIVYVSDECATIDMLYVYDTSIVYSIHYIIYILYTCMYHCSVIDFKENAVDALTSRLANDARV